MLRTPGANEGSQGGTTPSVETVGLKGETRSNHGRPTQRDVERTSKERGLLKEK